MTVRDLTTLGCSSQQPTRNRNHGAYLLRWEGEGMLFDPGEGTQRQFIHAGIAPPCVNRIFVSHFHGDHCLGLGSFLMRLNLDGVKHPIHCYYPASGKKYFDRLRYGTIYHETIHVIEHPIQSEGIIDSTDRFTIEAYKLDHGIENYGYRIVEKDQVHFHKEQLKEAGICGRDVRKLLEDGKVTINRACDKPSSSGETAPTSRPQTYLLEEFSYTRRGDIFAYISDTRLCSSLHRIAKDATLLLCESTYQQAHAHLAKNHYHLTAEQAAQIAAQAGACKLVLTHFSARYHDTRPLLEEARALFPNVVLAADCKRIPFERNPAFQSV